MTIPRASYRLQFHKNFGFADASALAPYLRALGVSHVYASPYLKARPGSVHGYDIVDHRALNPEIGTEAEYWSMVDVFRENGLGQILDFVPNHMGVGGSENALWLDVLEWGQQSPYASWFDIDWQAPDPALQGKLLVPLLGAPYGTELEAGKLAVKFDAAEGSFAVWAYEVHKLPVCPTHYGAILGSEDRELGRIADAFENPASSAAESRRRARELKTELAALARERQDVLDAIARAVAAFNTGRNALDRLIRRQHWRIAHHRVADDEINYRRFFNINELAGIRVELPTVFDHAHAHVLQLIEAGAVEGLRIDHVDGLLDPKAYLDRLRGEIGQSRYLVVEKILAADEPLRAEWPVAGTTGYDFVNLVLGLLVDPAGEEPLSAVYAAFTGGSAAWADIVRRSKLRIMENELASELEALAREAAAVARQSSHTVDFTRKAMERGLKAVVAEFRVYRSYVDAAGAAEADRREIGAAIARARLADPAVEAGVFDFIEGLLTGDMAGADSGFSRDQVIRFSMKFQQYSGPVMAKGVEDTAFYRFNRFVALNEVGGDPATFALSVREFHEANAGRAAKWPFAMLATATHDTKRGEDVRARLAVLSELANEWSAGVSSWSEVLRRNHAGAELPDPNDEYLFYQLLIGTWPTEFFLAAPPSQAAVEVYARRLVAAMLKSVREAKLHTSWTKPDPHYEARLTDFIAGALDRSRSAEFWAAFQPFCRRVARLGIENSLVQTVLKLTVPGVPDIYQGAELWDLNLVDPDNRRPVDYDARRHLLTRCRALDAGSRLDAMVRLFEEWHDGAIKLAVISAILNYRREYPKLFEEGGYEALSIVGPEHDGVCAFARRRAERAVLVCTARFPARRAASPGWRGTSIALPEWAVQIGWRELLTERPIPPGQALAMDALLSALPVAVLASA